MSNVIVSQDTFIGGVGPVGTPMSSVGCYMLGSGLRGIQPAYLHSSFAALGTTSCFISGADANSLDHKTGMRFESISQQYVQIPDSTNYDFLNTFTINMYVRAHDANGINQGIVTKQDIIETWVNSVGNSFGMRAKINGTWHTALTTSYVANRWYMLTIMYNGSGIHFYLNGAEFYGENASGPLDSNNLPLYFGRYAAFNTYSDLDLSEVKLWNYALAPSEIAALYAPAYRRKCQDAYICQVDPSNLSSVKRCVVVNNFTSGSPGTITSSMGLVIAPDSITDSQSCYIFAGGEADVTWDTRFTVDNNLYSSWDNVILVTGLSRFNQIQSADVVYPITRFAKRFVRFLTREDPGTVPSVQPCWIQTHFQIEQSRACYISVVNKSIAFRSAFIPGEFNASLSSHAAYICNSEHVDTQPAYIAGTVTLQRTTFQSCYITTFNDTAVDAQPSFIRGLTATRVSKDSYIVVPGFIRGSRLAYVHSLTSTALDSQPTYVQGRESIDTQVDTYVRGHIQATLSQDCFIPAEPVAIASKGCFINCGSPNRQTKLAYMRANIPLTSSHALYLKAEINATDNQPSYVKGYVGVSRTLRTYVAGPVVTVSTTLKRCFISNNNPVATQYAFIVSAPQSKHDCYILCTGTATRSKAAFIEA